jgi:formylglycine-generating enzyme required for sulfatase activity/predicted Ser/Thr protein kinase
MTSTVLSLERRAEIANHAARCEPCHAALDVLLRSRTAEAAADPMASTLAVDRAKAEPDEPDEPQARRHHQLSAGDRIHRYVIEAMLGRGGMGVVYRARDPELGRAVAIKVLQRGSEGGERLRREAQALARLSHPNVVAVHDVGTHDGQPFIAMALVEGDTLRQWLATPRTRPAALDVLLAAGRGIAAAHKAGLIHRDLKPDNIFVAHNGQVLVGDFGLVRGTTSAEHEVTGSVGNDELAPWLTRSGMVLGTPAYMAPEQAAGDATMASDQFSFCVTAWEAFTRQRPFAGTTIAELLASIRAGSVTEPEGERALPPPIDAALRRGLAADPAQRFTSMTALLSALEPAIASRTGRHRVIWMAALALAVASAAAGTVYRAFRDPASPPQPPLVQQPASVQRPPSPPMLGMIWFPGGTFRMGRTAEEVERECKRLGADCLRDKLDREQPAREVTLSPFYLDELEATNEDVASWLNSTKYRLEVRAGDKWKIPRWLYLNGVLLFDLMPPHVGILRDADGRFQARPGEEHKPIGQISWDGAFLYCKEHGKRLPTEAEWEFAARGRTARRFPWGEEEPPCDEVAWGRDEGMPCAPRSLERGPLDVGTVVVTRRDWGLVERSLELGPLDVGTAPLDRTPEGVRDLGGNVMEWVQDQFIEPHLPECGKCADPLIEEPTLLQNDMRVLRGGSWVTPWHMTRSTMRARWKRAEVMVNAGVRCASR